MQRTLKASTRPAIALGIMFGSLSALCVSLYFARDSHDLTQLEPAGIFVGIYALTMALIYSVRVSVSDKGLMIRRWYVTTQEIPFSEIAHSDAKYLGERDWPVSLTIHRNDHLAAVTLGMKSVRKEDASWLCSLPQLKVVERTRTRHSGQR